VEDIQPGRDPEELAIADACSRAKQFLQKQCGLTSGPIGFIHEAQAKGTGPIDAKEGPLTHDD